MIEVDSNIYQERGTNSHQKTANKSYLNNKNENLNDVMNSI